MSRRAADRADIAPFYVMEVMRAAELRAAAGHDVLHLEVGQPSTPAPRGVIDAAHRALDDDVLGYTTAAGLEPLRRRVGDHYADWYGVDVDPDAVMFTVGASGAFVAAFLAAFDVGDRVVVPTPGYPCYRNALAALGCEVVDLPTTIDDRFQPTVAQLDALGPVDGLVLSSPSNPTGTMLDPERMAAVCEWCRANDVWFVSDEIYHGITYGQAAPTALEFDRDAIVINSFSKYFSMTGWRLGWMIAPDPLRTALTRIGQNVTIAAPTLSQLGALAAFDCHDECEENVRRYATNRELLLSGLPAAGITELAPADGAFYVWARTDHLADDSQALCARWLDELGIAATPGVDFDPTDGHRFVRFSFAGSEADVAQAVARLRDWTP
ncbi:MAG: aminotransferase class I/II-fold pyridoxal phosphate-dependent enzyme [Acidimicrobiales bacterium]|nr:aminotransferase class I/II-fold pyridoxal phosphate-dependent enzyme [Acidimicrobiales bacterium]